MLNQIFTKSFLNIPLNLPEALRYGGFKDLNPPFSTSLLKEALPLFSYKVCYAEYSATSLNGKVFGEYFSINSKYISAKLKDISSVVIFGATVGIDIDRLIAKYGRLSQVKGLFLQGLGAERVESLCDTFCKFIADEKSQQNLFCYPRLSPGYGDFDISFQKNIFSLLDLPKHIGLTLNDSLLMSPSKSVTAIIGITKNNTTAPQNKYENCNKTCDYRRNNEF